MRDEVAALIDRDEACRALRENTARVSALLRRVKDPNARAIGTWTVGDVANHLSWGVENYALWLQGGEAADLDAIKNMAQWNVDTVRNLPPADLPALTQRLDAATERFIEAARGEPASAPVRWYAGNRIPAQVAVSMRLVEAVIHGRDIAKASGEKWRIDSDHARTMSYGVGYIGPYLSTKANSILPEPSRCTSAGARPSTTSFTTAH